uniref:C2 domain-containing protein n=1 Tax=Mesocestoides corti TaxID=53468 RepID=A0A5K3G574_MESCO
YAYWVDQRKPERDADCIDLRVRIQLTSGGGINNGSKLYVAVNSIVNDKVILTNRTAVVVRAWHDTLVHVDLGLVSQPSVNVYVAILNTTYFLQVVLQNHKF